MLRTAGILCGLLVLAISVHAGQDNKPKTTKDAPAKTPKTQKTAPPAKKAPSGKEQPTQSGVVVAVDPTTRQIRPPTPVEMQNLGQRGNQPNIPAPETQGPGGAVNVELGPEFQTFTVVTRTPDGKVQVEEVTGEKTAKERVAPKQTPQSSDGK